MVLSVTRPPVRTFSLSSAPNAATYRISVTQEPRGAASRYLNLGLPHIPHAEGTAEEAHDEVGDGAHDRHDQ